MSNPSLREIELPTTEGSSVTFWIGNDQYLITADEPDVWSVLEYDRARRLHRIGEFVGRNDRYYEFTETDGLSRRPQDWRKLVNSFI